MKAAAAIDLALTADKTPLRLQRGRAAVDAVRGHAEALIAESRHWKHTALFGCRGRDGLDAVPNGYAARAGDAHVIVRT
jgi:hypothetical protein